MRHSAIEALLLIPAVLLTGCSGPVEAEAALDPTLQVSHVAGHDPSAGWQSSLAAEEAARIAADEALRELLGSLTMEYVEVDRVLDPFTSATVLVDCPQGALLTGGGARRFAGIGSADLLDFGQEFSNTWRAVFSNNSANTLTVRATAFCLVLP